MTQGNVVRRVVGLGIAFALTAATGIAMIAAAVLMQPPALAPLAVPDTRIVERFYVEANDAIASGDLSGLRLVVAPHFVEQAPMPGEGAGRDGLEAYLTLLHQIDPTLRLAPVVIAGAGDLIVAQVMVQRDAAAPSSENSGNSPSPWGSVDVFRIAGGAIVERWSQTDGSGLVRPLARHAFSLPAPVPRVVTIDRLTLGPGARWTSHALGPYLLVAETGTLRVQTIDANASAPTGSPAPHAPLAAGQSLGVAADVSFSMSNAGAASARVLLVTFAVPQLPGGEPVESTLPPDIYRETLVGGLATKIGVGRLDLVLDQLLLAPGAQYSLSGAEGPVLIAVESGQLGLAASEPVWIRSGSDGMHRGAREAVLAAGDGALLDTPGLVMLRNSGEDPVAALVVALRADRIAPPPAATMEPEFSR